MALFDAVAQGVSQGLSSAGYAAGDLYAKQALNEQTNDLETARQQRLIEFKANLETTIGNQQREAQVSRIDAKTAQLAGQQVDKKYGDISARTPDEQDRLNATRATEDTSSMINDPRLRARAAAATGDISPKDAASMNQSAEISQMKLDNLLARAEDKNANMLQIANIRADAITAAAQLRVDAANQRALHGKIDTATGRMLITSEDANIKASTSQMAMLQRELQDVSQGPKGDPRRSEIQSQIQGLRDDIAQSKSNKASYLKSMGYLGGNESASPTEKTVKEAMGDPALPTPSADKKPPLSSFIKN